MTLVRQPWNGHAHRRRRDARAGHEGVRARGETGAAQVAKAVAAMSAGGLLGTVSNPVVSPLKSPVFGS